MSYGDALSSLGDHGTPYCKHDLLLRQRDTGVMLMVPLITLVTLCSMEGHDIDGLAQVARVSRLTS